VDCGWGTSLPQDGIVIRYLVVLSQCWRENIFFSPWNVFCLGERGARNAVDRCATRGWLVTCGQTPWASMQWQACLRPHVTTRAHAEPSQKRPLSRVNVSHHTSTIGCDTPLAKKNVLPDFSKLFSAATYMMTLLRVAPSSS
jgi:hypothetical protein